MGWQYQEAEVYKPKKREPMPKYNYEAARASFKFSSLFTRPEVIESLGTVTMIHPSMLATDVDRTWLFE